MNEALGEIENCYSKFVKIVGVAEKCEGQGNEIVENEFTNPFYHSYKIVGIVKEARSSCISMVVSNFMRREMPNITSNHAEVVKFLDENEGRLAFDVQLIEDFLRVKYEDRREDLSMKEILNGVLDMMPGKWDLNGRDRFRVGDILKNRTLKLRFAWDPFRYESFHPYDGVKRLSAFEKLMWVVLRGASPVKIDSHQLPGLYWNQENEGALAKKEVGGPFMESLKLYKNGKINITFKDPEAARKIAEKLVEEKNKTLPGL